MGFEEFQNTIMGIEEIISISKSMGEDYAVLHGKCGTSGKLDWANFIVIDIRETTEE